MVQGDGFLGIDMGCGSLLVAESGPGWCVFWSSLSCSGIWSSRRCRLSASAVVTRQSTEALEVFRPSGCSLRCLHLEICALSSGLVLYSRVSGVWVLLLEYREFDYSGYAVERNAWLDHGDRLCLGVA